MRALDIMIETVQNQILQESEILTQSPTAALIGGWLVGVDKAEEAVIKLELKADGETIEMTVPLKSPTAREVFLLVGKFRKGAEEKTTLRAKGVSYVLELRPETGELTVQSSLPVTFSPSGDNGFWVRPSTPQNPLEPFFNGITEPTAQSLRDILSQTNPDTGFARVRIDGVHSVISREAFYEAMANARKNPPYNTNQLGEWWWR